MKNYQITYSFYTKTAKTPTNQNSIENKVLATLTTYQMANNFVQNLLNKTDKFKEAYLDKWVNDVPNYREEIRIIPLEVCNAVDIALLNNALKVIS